MIHKMCWECKKIGHRPDMLKVKRFYIGKVMSRVAPVLFDVMKTHVIYVHKDCLTKKYHKVPDRITLDDTNN